MAYPDKVILAGFMGTGKSAVGKKLAQKLGYPFLDTDEMVEELSGKSIPAIFKGPGEAVFRKWERKAIDQALTRPRAVISVGGGAVCSETNFRKLSRAGAMILLKAKVSTMLQRSSRSHHRPLLRVPNPEKKIRELLAQRSSYYDRIPWRIRTDARTPADLVREISALLPLEKEALKVQLGERSYPIYFKKDGLKFLNLLLKKHCDSQKVVLVTNTTLDPLLGREVANILKKDFRTHKIVLPDGERYKNLRTVEKLYQEFLRAEVDRKTPVIALGGGVIGDIAGFGAATFLRGVPLIHVPTSLLAQVDSSVGGKTGVDLVEGKNLVGAFYQPEFVLIQETLLSTLSARQLQCGLAEVIKYAAIFDAKLFRTLEEEMEKLLRAEGRGFEPILRRCCQWKAWVVERDELETMGLRSQLNFGHTLGHAIESLTRYKKFTHGEAIAMGMAFAADRSVEKTGLKGREAARLKALLNKAGLPTLLPSFKKRDYRKALMQDKKRVSELVNFVYLKKIGKAVVVPTSLEEIM